MLRRCTGRLGMCSTGRPHQILSGGKPGTSLAWTQVAEPYCKNFCRCMAGWMRHIADSRELANLNRLAHG